MQEEWTYVDSDSNDTRATDIVAGLDLFKWGEGNAKHVRPRLNLIVECKQSDLPYVFFVDDQRIMTRTHPIGGLRSDSIEVITDEDPSTW